MPRIANVSTRELLRLLRRMRFVRSNSHHILFPPRMAGYKEIAPSVMGKIAIDDLKMNSADEFRPAARRDIPRRYLDPDAPWDGQPLE